MTDLADIVTSAFWRGNPPASDPQETRDWLDTFDAVVQAGARETPTFELRHLPEERLAHAGREAGGKGLTSYRHPCLMPESWQFPTGSMGLGPLNEVCQARCRRSLEHRAILQTARRKVWAFVGDGEMDEPES